ncbi:MAG: Rieske (2Fe-2S) protein [Actinomycetota bacterium]
MGAMPQWVDVVAEDDLEEGEPVLADALGTEVCLVLADGDVYALQNDCPNDGQPLGEGEMQGDTVLVCPKGDAHFDVTTGEALKGCETDLETFEVRVVGGVVQVGLE